MARQLFLSASKPKPGLIFTASRWFSRTPLFFMRDALLHAQFIVTRRVIDGFFREPGTVRP